MPEPRAQRTLVKSPPELWAEVSDVSILARHLGEFGEIRITRLEAETTVVWEGDRARGTVELEASGWGTKVTITAEAIATDAVEEVEVVEAEVVEAEIPEVEVAEEAVEVAVEEEEPVEAEVVGEVTEVEVVAEVEEAPAPQPAPRRGFLARLLRRRAGAATTEPLALEPPEPEPDTSAVATAVREPEPEPEPVAIEPEIVPTLAAPEPEPIPEPVVAAAVTVPDLDGEIAAAAAPDPEQVEAVLVGVLDDLGSAHHRPFSRG